VHDLTVEFDDFATPRKVEFDHHGLAHRDPIVRRNEHTTVRDVAEVLATECLFRGELDPKSSPFEGHGPPLRRWKVSDPLVPYRRTNTET
jgi:hypothetical protein